MKSEQRVWHPRLGWRRLNNDTELAPSLVLFFAAPVTMDDGARFAEMRAMYPDASLMGCTTGGEIAGEDVYDGSITATAIEFEQTRHVAVQDRVGAHKGSFDLGVSLAARLPGESLRGVFLLPDGTTVNGTDLVAGIQQVLGNDIGLTGGLAGDGADFTTTKVGLDANPDTGNVAAIGFYGEHLRLGYGSVGGWDAVGPEREITRSEGNKLFDLDGEAALDLYKQYLGPEAKNLPASALLFPLSIHPKGQKDTRLVRTVVGIDEAQKAMIFAGDVPEGHVAQVMLGNFDHLIAGAGRAAQNASIAEPKLAILVSCIGRKLLLGQRIGDEIEAVAQVFGPQCQLTGFYSYGEIAPGENVPHCELHNQTMTITTFAEG